MDEQKKDSGNAVLDRLGGAPASAAQAGKTVSDGSGMRPTPQPVEPEEPEVEEDPGREAMKAAANAPRAEELPEEVQRDALEWLMADLPVDESGTVIGGTKTLELDVSLPGEPVTLIEWIIRPIDADELRQAQRKAAGNRKTQRSALATGGTLDQREINIRVVQMATVYPDLVKASKDKLNAEDPAAILRRRFHYKPGLIDQIAAEVMSISGYEEDQVRVVDEVRAAGN